MKNILRKLNNLLLMCTRCSAAKEVLGLEKNLTVMDNTFTISPNGCLHLIKWGS